MKESDIRPPEVVETYLRLCAEDAEECFAGFERSEILCPACGSGTGRYEFTKHGFSYSSCDECGTLYQSPRPPVEAFEAFYENSRSSRYWAEVFFPVVAEARREHIFRPRAKHLASICNQKGLKPETVVDVGAGYGIFLEEWQRIYPGTKGIAVEPFRRLANVCRERGLEVVEGFAEDVDSYAETGDLVVCFEVLEHVYDPLGFVRALSQFAKPNGYVMVSTLGVDGFDIQVLWEKSKSIFPPHHINFLSVDGFRRLFSRSGFVQIEVLTPGKLDVDIVRNAYLKDPTVLDEHRYIKALISDRLKSENFQTFLCDNLLSSHVWIFAKKNNMPNNAD